MPLTEAEISEAEEGVAAIAIGHRKWGGATLPLRGAGARAIAGRQPSLASTTFTRQAMLTLESFALHPCIYRVNSLRPHLISPTIRCSS